MRRNVNILTAALLVLVATFQANAYFSQGDAGQEVFSFMSTFDSPRNAALEKSAAAAPSTDPSIAQLNPAALRMPEGKERTVGMHWQTGEFAEKYLKKGMKILISGRIQTGNYTDKETGKKVYTTDVVVEEHEFCESKKDSGAPSNPANDEEFMTVPDGQESLLPF